MFSEGGNYGSKEAVNTIHSLNELNSLMSDQRIEIIVVLKRQYYESITGIKQCLSTMIEPLVLLWILIKTCFYLVSVFNYRVNIELVLRKKILDEKTNAINTLLDTAIKQECTSLKKRMAVLHEKACAFNRSLENNNVSELSKCWSELLPETEAFIGFLLESYRDLST